MSRAVLGHYLRQCIVARCFSGILGRTRRCHVFRRQAAEVRVIALAVVLYAPIHAQVLRRVTDLDPDGIHGWSVGDAGSVAVAVWGGDPLGTNPHPVNQIFKWVIPSGAVSQLTNLPGGVTRNVSITDDAQWIVFDSSSDPVQQNGDGTVELFRMRTDGSQITQLTNDDLLGEGRP